MPTNNKDYAQEYYQKNKKKQAEHQRKYYRDNKDKILKRNRAVQKLWYQNNKERILKDKKEWRQRMLGSLEYRFKRAIQAAKQRGILFSLTFDQFVEATDQPCYYCANKFCSQVVEGSGLDRIDSTKGYEIGNIVSCGKRCNWIKMHDLTLEETKAAIDAILQVRLKVITKHEKEKRDKEGSLQKDQA